MKVKTPVAAKTRRLAKAWLFASALLLATLALAQDSRPASADHTDIFFTLSDSDPTPLTSITLIINDLRPPTLYVWARNVHAKGGVGAFEIDIHYMSGLVTMNSFTLEDPMWLASTGRSVFCPGPPVIDPNLGTGGGVAHVSCNTLSGPDGPQGSGILVSLELKAGVVLAETKLVLDDDRTFLVDTGQITVNDQGTPTAARGPEVIPTTKLSLQIVIVRCGDVNDDNAVTIDDIFLVAAQFGMTLDPNNIKKWDPVYDMNVDNAITIDDIFLNAAQFGRECSNPP